jgi:hypothetical protein
MLESGFKKASTQAAFIEDRVLCGATQAMWNFM